MATTVGTLEFQFIADIARLKQDMEEVKRSVGSTTSFIESAAATAKGALAGIAAGLTVGAFAGWIKSAIDAGDATKEFSQKTGVAAKDVAGLQLAFKLGGVEGDALTSAIGKLSKNMAAGSDAFAQMGVSVRNSDGTLRSVKDVITDVAEATKAMGDGAAKSALLQQVFGKSAAALIPTLNEGAAGMREMAGEADRLGLSISAEAAEESDKFNDTLTLLGASVQGIGRKIAADLLPQLQSLADMLKDPAVVAGATAIAEGIAKIVGAIISAPGAIVGFSDSLRVMLGGAIPANREIGLLNAELNRLIERRSALASAKTGFFGSNAAEIAATDAQMAGVIERLAALSPAMQSASADAASLGAENKKLAAETAPVVIQTKEQMAAIQAAANAYQSYRDKLLSYRTELEQTISGGEKASAAQKMLAELTANNTAAVMKITKERRLELIEIAKQNVELEKTAVARDTETKAIAQAMESIRGKNASLKEEIAAQTSANEQARGGADASGLLAIAKLREAAATAERTAAITLETSGNQELADQYREQANLLNQLADQKGQGIEIERAKQAAEEWKKTTDSIGQSLTDALLRGFESGAKFADVFKNTLINMFQTLVLRPIIQPIVQGAAGLVTGALGLSANASTGGGMGGLSTLSGLSTLYKAGSLLPGVQDYAFNQLGRLATQPGIIGDVGLAGFNYAGSLAQAPGGLVGGGLLSAGAGWAGGQLGNMVFGGGGQANTGAALGGFAGSIAGSLVPVIGPYIGAALGSFFGSGIGSLFGNNKTPKTQFTTIASDADRGGLQDYNKLMPKGRAGETFAESAFGVIGLGGKTRQVDAQDFKQTFDAIAAIDNALAAALNPDQIIRVQNALKGFTSGVNATAAEYTRDRLVLVARTIDDTMGKIVDGFKGGVDDLASFTQALAIVQQYTTTDIGGQITAMADAAKNASTSLFDTWQSSSSQLSDLANGFDGSLSKALELSALTQSTGQMELALVSQIQQALTATHAMFGATIDQIKLSVLDTAGQYDFLRARADELEKQLSTAFDPTQISQIAGQINAITQQAYGLLDAGQKQTAAPEFIQYLNDVDALTTDRLNASQDKIVATHQAMADAIESAMTRVADKMAAAAQEQSNAAGTMSAAAGTMLSAAGQPITINVNPLGGGGEIAFA